MGRLEGKTALVTGAARGLGAAIARRFADEGATVIINDLNLDAARSTAEKLGGHGVAADVSDSASVAAMFAEVKRLVPRLDILVNNAGISGLEGRNDVDQLIARRAKLAQELASGGPVTSFIDGTAQTTDCTLAAHAGRARRRHLLLLPGGAEDHEPADVRRHRQHLERDGHIRPAGQRALFHGQGSDPRPHALAGSRGRAAQHPRQCHCAGVDRHGHDRTPGRRTPADRCEHAVAPASASPTTSPGPPSISPATKPSS